MPNPDIETRNIVQALGMYSESKKIVATSLVVRHFLDWLGVLRGCAIIVFSLSGFGITPKALREKKIELLSVQINTKFIQP